MVTNPSDSDGLFKPDKPITVENEEMADVAIKEFMGLYKIGGEKAITPADNMVVGIALKIKADNTRQRASENNRVKTTLQVGKAITDDPDTLASWLKLSRPPNNPMNPNNG